jgi:hypothetical protein
MAITNQKGVITYVNDNFVRFQIQPWRTKGKIIVSWNQVVIQGIYSCIVTIGRKDLKGEIENRKKDGSL